MKAINTSAELQGRDSKQIKHLRFYKEHGLWYADLPEFLALGLGSKNNLLMVDGADTFLDFLSNQGNSVQLSISTQAFEDQEGHLKKRNFGLNQEILDMVGHAPVGYGAYYQVQEWKGEPFAHQLWLCPVTEWVFGYYPDNLYIKIQSH